MAFYSTTSNACRPSLIRTPPGHEIGLVCYNTIEIISAILQYRAAICILHYCKIAKLAKLSILVLRFGYLLTCFCWLGLICDKKGEVELIME